MKPPSTITKIQIKQAFWGLHTTKKADFDLYLRNLLDKKRFVSNRLDGLTYYWTENILQEDQFSQSMHDSGLFMILTAFMQKKGQQ